MMSCRCLLILLIISINYTYGLDNGLALTPPMGWLSWERFGCIIDCENRPDECISEYLMVTQADLLVSEGYSTAGYEYVVIDDCWPANKRGPDDKLVPDSKRFPKGMKYIGDYLHKKKLKFGIYQAVGTKTCEGYPGVGKNMELDTKTFAEWGVDYIKLDGCYDAANFGTNYPKFGQYLNKTGRPIVYSCSWPAYQGGGENVDYESIAKHCNLWRNFGNIDDSWTTVDKITNFYGKKSKFFQKFAGPGHWNDPDTLIIGNYGLSIDQSQVQMAVWAILAAPLLISADLKTIRPEFKEILQNSDVIGVNQDRLGLAGILLLERNRMQVWKREITPIVDNLKSMAFAFVNFNTDGAPRIETFTFDELEIPSKSYKVKNLYTKVMMGISSSIDKFTVKVNPSGVQMFKFTPQSSDTLAK